MFERGCAARTLNFGTLWNIAARAARIINRSFAGEARAAVAANNIFMNDYACAYTVL